MKHAIIFFVMILIFSSCEEDEFGEVVQQDDFLFSQNGVFIINEGNFSHSNGSVSFYSFDSAKVYNHAFLNRNERPPGDVPNHMAIKDTLALLTVNNSAKVEIVSAQTLAGKASVSLGSSPREAVFIDDQTAVISDLYSDSLTLVDIESRSVARKIGIGRSSESMVMASGKLFVANWSMLNHPGKENNQIMVVDVEAGQVVDSITVTKEPNSMIRDKPGKLWVLSSGGFENEEYPALTRINPENNEVEKVFSFPDKETNPVNLTANITGDTVYWLNRGVYSMDITGETLPEHPDVEEGDGNFYSLAISDHRILVSDAIDFQQRGEISVYTKSFEFDTVHRAGIIPGFMKPVKP